MDQKGQISIEFVLVIAFVLVLVLLFLSYIGEQNEQNAVLSAARSGAMNATSEAVFLNKSIEPVRVDDMRIIGSGHNLTIQMNLSGASNSTRIINSTLNSIAALGYKRINSTNPESDPLSDYINTTRHTYHVTVV